MARRTMVLLVLLACVGASPALGLEFGSIGLVVDSAPNAYGSALYAPWWTQAKADVVAGTFTDMRNGTLPGTHYMDPYDEIVYSTGDLGKRLHWIYWLPTITKAELNNRFQVKMVFDWDGVDYTYDWSQGGAMAENGAEIGWTQPGSWADYQGGVIGTFGHAWWAVDDDAYPYNSGGTPYDETDQADIDALRQDIFKYQTFARGIFRYRDGVDQDWQYGDLQVNVVPEPSSLFLVGAVMLGSVAFAHYRRKRR